MLTGKMFWFKLFQVTRSRLKSLGSVDRSRNVLSGGHEFDNGSGRPPPTGGAVPV